jgi:Zn-dependent protease/CBS domain-containing protein
MFTKRIPLFTLFGFRVSVDLTWLILAVLITWSLAAGLFPTLYPDLAKATYWWMGVVGALGLLGSIVVHELSHSLVGRLYGMPIKGITLFIFGGVAEMHEEPTSPKGEFRMAIVGPLTSLLVAALFYLLTAGGKTMGWPVPVTGVLGYLAILNVILAVFNMVPAFPLDGGRVLRAALWRWKGSFLWATRIASNFGSGFGLVLILVAVLSVLGGNFIAGMWWFLIGLFVRGAAQSTYQQTVMRHALRDVPVRRFMTENPVTVPSSLSIETLVDDVFYKHYFKTFPVVDGERLVGCVNLRDIKEVPRERWREDTVRDVMQDCSGRNTVEPATDAATALSGMMRTRTPRLLVADGERLIGIVSQSDILRFLAVKLDLEEGDRTSPGETLGATRDRLLHDSR